MLLLVPWGESQSSSIRNFDFSLEKPLALLNEIDVSDTVLPCDRRSQVNFNDVFAVDFPWKRVSRIPR